MHFAGVYSRRIQHGGHGTNFTMLQNRGSHLSPLNIGCDSIMGSTMISTQAVQEVALAGIITKTRTFV
jgi:hypothetical protein